MKDLNIVPAKDDRAGEAMPARRRKGAQAPDQQRLISDERRVLDALEDDEVRESLRASRKLSPRHDDAASVRRPREKRLAVRHKAADPLDLRQKRTRRIPAD